MVKNKDWSLKGVFYECCRIEGHCPLWFGRELWDKPCTSLATFQITEGQIENVNISGITIVGHCSGIGPKFTDLAKGVEFAVYISDNATKEQRKVLEPFVKNHLGAKMQWKRCLGIKYVKINIKKQDKTFHITMPFGEMKMSLTVGGDGINPITMENPRNTDRTNVRFCNTEFWKYHDYGKNLEFHSTSGVIADFAL